MSEIAEMRSKVCELEKYTRQMPQVDIKTVHHFAPGLVAREVHIPAGALLTGRIHKYENLNILSKGQMSVSINGDMVMVSAPFTVVSPPGTKRVVLAHTDCVWTTILATDETDPEKIETIFTASNDAEYLAHEKSLNLKGE